MQSQMEWQCVKLGLHRGFVINLEQGQSTMAVVS